MSTRKPRIVVITGATSGVGRATARRFARAGASIALLARGRDGLEATARDVEELGGKALALATDVADEQQVSAAAERVEHDLGPIDLWINNAMTTVFSRATDLDAAELRRVTDVTYLGAVWGTLAALRYMAPRNRGVILQVGSALAYRSIPLQSAYCGAKHALHGFTDSLRSELIHEKLDVRLTMVQLPAVNTPQFRECRNHLDYEPQPVPPIYQPEVIAEGIFRAARGRRREVYLGWPTVKAVLGQSLIPGTLDRYLAHAGWEGQFTDERSDPGRSDNLFAPVPGDHGARGAFSARARRRDRVSRVTGWLGGAGVRAAAIGVGVTAIVGAVAALSAGARRLGA